MYTFEEVNTALEKEALSDALYKLQRFAHAQGLSELEEWTELELSGYADCNDKGAEEQARKYRTAPVQWRDIYHRPVTISPEVSFLNNQVIWFGVVDLEGVAEKGIGYSSKSTLDLLGQITDVPLSGVWLFPEHIQSLLNHIRFQARTRLHDSIPRNPIRKIIYPAPNFGHLVTDPQLANILSRRWNEANYDYEGGAYLSTVIMLGSILEGVLLAKVEQNPAKSNTATATPKDGATGKPPRFFEWKLADLINVSHECGWLKKEAKDFAHVVRDYRNFVHPNKERQEGVTIDANTCRIVFEVVSAALDVGSS